MVFFLIGHTWMVVVTVAVISAILTQILQLRFPLMNPYRVFLNVSLPTYLLAMALLINGRVFQYGDLSFIEQIFFVSASVIETSMVFPSNLLAIAGLALNNVYPEAFSQPFSITLFGILVFVFQAFTAFIFFIGE